MTRLMGKLLCLLGIHKEYYRIVVYRDRASCEDFKVLWPHCERCGVELWER